MRILRTKPQPMGENEGSGVRQALPYPGGNMPDPQTMAVLGQAPNLDDPLANFIGDVEAYKRRKKQRSKATPSSQRKQQILAIEQRIESQKTARTEAEREACWQGVTAGQLVALYWVCHVKLYGVAPAELEAATTWSNAMKCAGSMVAKQFDGDVQRAVHFMRWTWLREREREEWRKARKIDGKRLTWQQQFIYLNLVTDWRAAKVRVGA
jgi:hypothetical protein